MTLGTCIATVGALWIAAGSGLCQPSQPAPLRAPAPYYEDTNNIPVSPEVHPDHTVTFRLFAPKASEVVLMGSPGILEAIKEPKPLQKDDTGVWSVTVGPLAPTQSTADCACLIPRIRTWNCAAGGLPACL